MRQCFAEVSYCACKQACTAAGSVLNLLLFFFITKQIGLLTASALNNGGDIQLMQPIKSLLAATSAITWRINRCKYSYRPSKYSLIVNIIVCDLSLDLCVYVSLCVYLNAIPILNLHF